MQRCALAGGGGGWGDIRHSSMWTSKYLGALKRGKFLLPQFIQSGHTHFLSAPGAGIKIQPQYSETHSHAQPAQTILEYQAHTMKHGSSPGQGYFLTEGDLLVSESYTQSGESLAPSKSAGEPYLNHLCSPVFSPSSVAHGCPKNPLSPGAPCWKALWKASHPLGPQGYS